MFLEQLAQLAADHPTTPKWVIVPGQPLGWTLGERLVNRGVNWANFRFVTPFRLALQMAAPDLVAEGVNPNPEGLGPSLVLRLLLDLPSESGHFRPLAEQPRMAEALWATLHELRMAGISSLEGEGPKLDEVRSLLEAYLRFLQEHRFADRAMVFERARSFCPVKPGDLVIEFPGCTWAPVERRFLEGLPGRKLEARAPDDRSFVAPEAVKLFRAGDEHAQVEWVFRELVAAGRRADEAEVAAPSQRLLELAWEKAARFGLPATLEPGRPVASMRSGGALLGLLDWMASGYPAVDLRNLVLGGWLEFPGAASMLAASGATWGRQTYRRSLEALSFRYRERAERDESWLEKAERALALADWIEGLFPPGDAVELGEWVEFCLALLERTAPDEGHPPLRRALRELGNLAGLRRPLEEAVRLVRERVETLRCGHQRPRPGHLHLTSLDRVGLSGRPCTFVLGLEEGEVFRQAVQDPVLLDHERAPLGLPTSSDLVERHRSQLVRRLNSLQGEVWMGCSALEAVPSWLMLHAAGAPSYQQLDQVLGEPVSRLDGPALGILDGCLRGHVAPGVWLERGARAQAERESERFTGFDGRVPEAAGALDPRRTGRPVSASRLEELAECPFRYFLEQGLGTRANELSAIDPDRWLDPLLRGSLLHEVYALFWSELRDQGRRPGPGDRGRLLALCEERLAALEEHLPCPREQLRDEETARLKKDLEVFLELEAGEERVPVGLEVPFGLPEESDEPLATADPVELDLGDGMRFFLRGRIDRLDRLPDGSYEVVDYKTGRTLKGSLKGVYRGGRLLQHALYALVAEQLVDGPVAGSSYYFPVAGVEEPRIRLEAPDKDRLRSLLRDLMEPLETGAFVHTGDKNNCRYCDYRRVCGRAVEQAAAKADDPALGFVERLKNYA